MKKIRNRFLTICNTILASIISLLGVASCCHKEHQKSAGYCGQPDTFQDKPIEDRRMQVMYGPPPAEFRKERMAIEEKSISQQKDKAE